MYESVEASIQRLMGELKEEKDKIRVVKDSVRDLMEQNDEYRAMQEELKELTTKRASAKKLLQADNEFQKLNSELEELKFKYKDLQEILSHHLVTYYNQTQKTEVTGESGETYQVVVSAKLGRPTS